MPRVPNGRIPDAQTRRHLLHAVTPERPPLSSPLAEQHVGRANGNGTRDPVYLAAVPPHARRHDDWLREPVRLLLSAGAQVQQDGKALLLPQGGGGARRGDGTGGLFAGVARGARLDLRRDGQVVLQRD